MENQDCQSEVQRATQSVTVPRLGKDDANPISPGGMTRLGVVDQHSFTRECISNCLRMMDRYVHVMTFSRIKDCFTPNMNLDLILLHLHGNNAEQFNRSTSSLVPMFRSIPVIILSQMDIRDSVVKSLERGARGYISTNTSTKIVVRVIHLVKAGGTFLPAKTLQKIQRTPPSRSSLTSRQLSVLHHLEQGKSNKIIAFELGISESTVKVHVTSILKKMQASNRTEAALRASRLSLAEQVSETDQESRNCVKLPAVCRQAAR